MGMPDSLDYALVTRGDEASHSYLYEPVVSLPKLLTGEIRVGELGKC